MRIGVTHKERMEEIAAKVYSLDYLKDDFESHGRDWHYLLTRVRVLTEALEFYAHKIKWNPHAYNSYSSRMYAPDWSGELGIDEPWEPARKALEGEA